MKISKLILELVNYLNQYGDLDVQISLLSENGDIDLEITSVDEWYRGRDCQKATITHEVKDIKAFKNNIKEIY